jgi:thiaminase
VIPIAVYAFSTPFGFFITKGKYNMHYPKLTGLSKKLWQHSQPDFEKVTKTPLVTGLIAGLSTEKFHRFTQQDIYYLENIFQPAMKALSQKASALSHKKLFSDFIIATDIELTQLKSHMSSDCTEPPIQPSEVCERYGTHLLETTGNQSYSIGIAACLPCFLFFPAVGLHIKNNVPNLSIHPQAGWIKVYAEELFDNAYQMAALANEVIHKEEEKMAVKAYMTSAEFELSFFEDALELEVIHSYSMAGL